MKKILIVLAVLCVSLSVFAESGVTVKAGGVFSFVNGKTPTSDELPVSQSYSFSGFGFDIGAEYELFTDVSAWIDFNMEFPKDAKMGDQKVSEIKELFPGIKISLLSFSVAIGGAYKLPLDLPIELKAGLGFFLERSSSKESYEGIEQKMSFMNMGAALYLDARYELFENVKIGLTLMPRVGIYSICKVESVSASGVKIGFGMPIVLGASYSF